MIGAQLGGTAFLQLLGRIRVAGPLYTEAGLFVWGPTPMANGSAGVVVDVPILGNLSTYAGAGLGFGWTTEENMRPGCEEKIGEDCILTANAYLGFGHSRVGLGYRLPDRGIRIGVDVGFWYGRAGDDGGIDQTAGSHPFLIPMAGFAVLHEL